MEASDNEILITKQKGEPFGWKFERLENGLKIIDVDSTKLAEENGIKLGDGDTITKVYDDIRKDDVNLSHQDFDQRFAELERFRITVQRKLDDSSVEPKLTQPAKRKRKRKGPFCGKRKKPNPGRVKNKVRARRYCHRKAKVKQNVDRMIKAHQLLEAQKKRKSLKCTSSEKFQIIKIEEIDQNDVQSCSSSTLPCVASTTGNTFFPVITSVSGAVNRANLPSNGNLKSLQPKISNDTNLLDEYLKQKRAMLTVKRAKVEGKVNHFKLKNRLIQTQIDANVTRKDKFTGQAKNFELRNLELTRILKSNGKFAANLDDNAPNDEVLKEAILKEKRAIIIAQRAKVGLKLKRIELKTCLTLVEIDANSCKNTKYEKETENIRLKELELERNRIAAKSNSILIDPNDLEDILEQKRTILIARREENKIKLEHVELKRRLIETEIEANVAKKIKYEKKAKTIQLEDLMLKKNSNHDIFSLMPKIY